jgi:hypothetical protein
MAGAALRKSGPKAAAPGPGWEEDALGFLIAPVTKAAFLERYYERESLVNIRHEARRYADLLTLDMLDHFLNSTDLREGMLDLTNHHNRISRDAYIDDAGKISRIAVAEEYLAGATIILPQLHESIFKLGEFCRALEEVFSCHVQTNIYLTPQPREQAETGNQGFPIHYDNHDVFVMQVSGAKAWRLYGTPVETPFRGERFELGRHDPGPVTQEFTLNPGDCVYVPRGVMHDAENVGAEPSLHITVGMLTKTWADLLLESISELALTSPDFRRSLPAGFAARDFDREAARVHFDRLRQEIADRAEMDSAFDLLADNFVRGRRPNVSGLISAAVPGPQQGDRFRRRRFVPWNVADDEGKLVLIGPGGDTDFEADDGDALDVALSGAPFTAGDLKCKDPDALIKSLWSGGYLERIA